MALTKSQQAAADWATVPHAMAHAHARDRALQAGMSASDRSRPLAETVRVLKSRSYENGDLHVVTYATLGGDEWEVLVSTFAGQDGSYRAMTLGGGWLTPPDQPPPWTAIGTSWGSACFRGGGIVYGPGTSAARRVRLRFANGVTLEDDVEDGCVLFETTLAVEPPLEVQVLDGEGSVLSSHSERG